MSNIGQQWHQVKKSLSMEVDGLPDKNGRPKKIWMKVVGSEATYVRISPIIDWNGNIDFMQQTPTLLGRGNDDDDDLNYTQQQQKY